MDACSHTAGRKSQGTNKLDILVKSPGNSLCSASRTALVLVLLIASAGCTTVGLTTSVGPSRRDVDIAANKRAVEGLEIVDLDSTNSPEFFAPPQAKGLAEVIGDAAPFGSIVGPGDVLSISIIEAPPAVLFGGGDDSSNPTSQGGSIPDVVVESSGRIFVPFGGYVLASGRTPDEIAGDIAKRLKAKAHLPQVSVRLAHNASANTTVVGEVNNAVRMPLTPKGERLLDALAAAGGVRQASDKITIQITRGKVVASMPLEAVIKDPRQNVVLGPNDIVTAIYQPFSFTVLGAATRSSEVEFEATGISLAQALGRVGGLQDQRANPKGVFLFRWEEATDGALGAKKQVPRIYRVNMKDPSTYFLMQNFAVHDKDVIYVANSPLAEFQRFVSILASTVLPFAAVRNAVN